MLIAMALAGTLYLAAGALWAVFAANVMEASLGVRGWMQTGAAVALGLTWPVSVPAAVAFLLAVAYDDGDGA